MFIVSCRVCCVVFVVFASVVLCKLWFVNCVVLVVYCSSCCAFSALFSVWFSVFSALFSVCCSQCVALSVVFSFHSCTQLGPNCSWAPQSPLIQTVTSAKRKSLQAITSTLKGHCCCAPQRLVIRSSPTAETELILACTSMAKTGNPRGHFKWICHNALRQMMDDQKKLLQEGRRKVSDQGALSIVHENADAALQEAQGELRHLPVDLHEENALGSVLT